MNLARPKHLIVIGGNAAGMAAALRARRRRTDLKITVIERTDRIAIANCSIPAYLEGEIYDIDSLQQLSIHDALTHHRIDVLSGHSATQIHPQKHILSVENIKTGQDFTLDYDRLVLSTGADPIHPNWPNTHARGIFTLRNLSDAKNLKQYIDHKKPETFVVIGTGTIAQVCVSALRSTGMKVSMIGQSDGLMDDLEEPISQRIIGTLESHDISLYYTDNLYGFKVLLDGYVSAVEETTKNFDCEGVLLAMGVNPNTDLALSAGISTGIQGAIRVDRHLMTSRQGIYACGDCAVTINRITKKPIYWPLATTASRQGRQAGESASGGQGYDPGTLAARLWTCFDLTLGRIGLSSSQAREQGLKAQTNTVNAASKPTLFGGDSIDIVLISDSETGRLYGAQLAGKEGTHARLNTLAAAIEGRLTVNDLEHLDLGYTPKISALWDPIQIAGRMGRKQH